VAIAVIDAASSPPMLFPMFLNAVVAIVCSCCFAATSADPSDPPATTRAAAL
jgi:hypothetical protein